MLPCRRHEHRSSEREVHALTFGADMDPDDRGYRGSLGSLAVCAVNRCHGREARSPVGALFCAAARAGGECGAMHACSFDREAMAGGPGFVR